MIKYLILLFALAILSYSLPAQDDPFDTPGIGDGGIVIEKGIVSGNDSPGADSVKEQLDRESVNFSGEIASSFALSLSRETFLGSADLFANPILTSIVSDFLLDVRLKKGIKAFACLGVSYSPQGYDIVRQFGSYPLPGADTYFSENINLMIRLKEFFLDTNINWVLYARAGKQVLKWGTGYLWNPTDYVNREKKNFLNIDSKRDGVYGLKVHVPFGTLVNLYGFADLTDALLLKEIAGAAKFEVLVGNTEVSASCWGKSSALPVFGLDITSRLLGFDLWGEASVSYGDNRVKLDKTSTSDLYISDTWISRVVLGISSTFDAFDEPDRIGIYGEFFYNQAGYTDNMFEDSVRDKYLSMYYVPNEYGCYYAALFIEVKKVFVSKLDFVFDAIGNFTDFSFLVSTSFIFKPVDKFELRFTVSSALGEPNREYTYTNGALTCGITLDVKF
jgi:hypothetical protein